ncbi:hypothetical protein VLK31_31220 [Variovorax sp. H27-G14]|uniref:hypothetical protein n=1 Tax=Variovorax sp. H27-G14 TaxID=3111914 RepID=UPI0038FC2C68
MIDLRNEINKYVNADRERQSTAFALDPADAARVPGAKATVIPIDDLAIRADQMVADERAGVLIVYFGEGSHLSPCLSESLLRQSGEAIAPSALEGLSSKPSFLGHAQGKRWERCTSPERAEFFKDRGLNLKMIERLPVELELKGRFVTVEV